MRIKIKEPVRILFTYENPPEIEQLRGEIAKLKDELRRYDYAFSSLTYMLFRLQHARDIIRELGGKPEKYNI